VKRAKDRDGGLSEGEGAARKMKKKKLIRGQMPISVKNDEKAIWGVSNF